MYIDINKLDMNAQASYQWRVPSCFVTGGGNIAL